MLSNFFEAPRPSLRYHETFSNLSYRQSCRHSAKCGWARAVNMRSRNEHRRVEAFEMRDIRRIRHGFRCRRVVANCVCSRSTTVELAAGQRPLDRPTKAVVCWMASRMAACTIYSQRDEESVWISSGSFACAVRWRSESICLHSCVLGRFHVEFVQHFDVKIISPSSLDRFMAKSSIVFNKTNSLSEPSSPRNFFNWLTLNIPLNCKFSHKRKCVFLRAHWNLRSEKSSKWTRAIIKFLFLFFRSAHFT